MLERMCPYSICPFACYLIDYHDYDNRMYKNIWSNIGSVKKKKFAGLRMSTISIWSSFEKNN